MKSIDKIVSIEQCIRFRDKDSEQIMRENTVTLDITKIQSTGIRCFPNKDLIIKEQRKEEIQLDEYFNPSRRDSGLYISWKNNRHITQEEYLRECRENNQP
jgi:hypothetical protein